MVLHATSASASWNAAAVAGRSPPSADRADRSKSPSGPATSGGPPGERSGEQDVLRLQVAMDDSLPVHDVEGAAQLLADHHGGLEG